MGLLGESKVSGDYRNTPPAATATQNIVGPLDLKILSTIRTETLRSNGNWIEISNEFLARRCTNGNVSRVRQSLRNLDRAGLITPEPRDGGGFGIVIEEIPDQLLFTAADRDFLRSVAVTIN